MLNLNLIKFTNRIISDLFAIDDRKAFRSFIKVIFLLLKNNGTLFTVRYMKQVKLHITRYMCGKPLMSNSNGVALVGGFPKRFLLLKPYIDSGKISSIKWTLTLLNFSRSIRPKKSESIPVSVKTITDPYKGTGYTIPGEFMSDFVKHFNLGQLVPTYNTGDFHLSTKSGPSGPSSATALWSFANFPLQLRERVYHLVKRPLSLLFLNVYKYSRFYLQYLKTGKGITYLGRLSIVKDPDCKMRVIAMLDYVTQFLLRPIHSALFRSLRNLPCDRTFTQDPRGPWLENQNSFWSLDLSAATDRLPIALQEKLIKRIFNSADLGWTWRELLQREYVLPQPGPKSGWHFEEDQPDTVRYAVGQPMGAYSSWASLAVTHHLIVLWSAHLCGYDLNFNQYIILGDDVVIKDDRVALKYISVMTRLGVDISESKTHVSKHTYEFAKRWIRGGVELSGLPLSGISDNITSPRIVLTILCEYIFRGNLYLFRGTVMELVIRALKLVQVRVAPRRGMKPRLVRFNHKYLVQLLQPFYTAYRWVLGHMSRDEERNLLVSAMVTEEMPVPAINCSPAFMRAVVTEEVVKLSVGTIYKYLDFKDNLLGYFQSFVDPIQPKVDMVTEFWWLIKRLPSLKWQRIVVSWIRDYELTVTLLWQREDPRHYRYQFSWYGLNNHIMRISDLTKRHIADCDSSSLIDIVKNLIFIDFDELASDERDVRKVMDSVSSVVDSALKALVLRRRLVAVSNNMEYILSGSLRHHINYKSIGFGSDSWVEPRKYESLWAPLARLDREYAHILADLSDLEEEVFRPPEPLPNWDW